jgi:hypothetical protein
MGKINFLSDKNNSGSAGDLPNDQENKEDLDIKWTSPEKMIPPGKDNNSAGDMLNTMAKIKNRLSFVDKRNNQTDKPLALVNDLNNKKSDLAASDIDSGKEIKKISFFGKIFGFKKTLVPRSFNKGEKDKDMANSEFKNKKEIIAGYGDVFNDEKNSRKNLNYSNGQNNASSQEDANAEKGRSEIEGNTALTGHNKWKAPKILKTDLIKDEVTVFIDWKKNIKNLSANLAMAIIIIAIAFFGLELWGKSSAQQVKTLDNEIKNLAQKINQSKAEIKEIDNFQKKLNLASKIIEKHIYWTNFFNFLEKDTLPSINFTGGFKGDTSGNYNFAAVAPSFNDLTDQVRVFKADTDNVLTVDVSKGALSGGTGNTQTAGQSTNQTNIEFNLLLGVNPKIFSK